MGWTFQGNRKAGRAMMRLSLVILSLLLGGVLGWVSDPHPNDELVVDSRADARPRPKAFSEFAMESEPSQGSFTDSNVAQARLHVPLLDASEAEVARWLANGMETNPVETLRQIESELSAQH